MRRIPHLAIAMIALSSLAIALAQNPAQPIPGQPGQIRQPGAQQGMNLDQELASWLIIDNQKEIALAELAQQKAQDDKVKEFARKMVEDHQQFISKLQRFAPNASQQALRIEGSASASREGTQRDADRSNDANRNQNNQNRDQNNQNRDQNQDRNESANQNRDQNNQNRAQDQNPAANQNRANPNQNQIQNQNAAGQREAVGQQPRVAGQQPARGGMPVTPLTLKRELAQECLNSAAKELSSKQAKEFDQCYMFSQVMAHMEMKDTLSVFKRHASQNLQAVLAEGLQTTEEHLKMAKEHAKSLDDATRTAARPGEDAKKE